LLLTLLQRARSNRMNRSKMHGVGVRCPRYVLSLHRGVTTARPPRGSVPRVRAS
jgi:hypothetical protein